VRLRVRVRGRVLVLVRVLVFVRVLDFRAPHVDGWESSINPRSGISSHSGRFWSS
jgi:hypothetical protein